MSVLDDLPQTFQCEAFKKLKEVSDVSKLSEEERCKYEYTLKKYRDLSCVVSTAKEKGIEEGLERGREEGRKKLLQGARSLKDRGIPLDVIQQSLGLTDEETHTL